MNAITSGSYDVSGMSPHIPGYAALMDLTPLISAGLKSAMRLAPEGPSYDEWLAGLRNGRVDFYALQDACEVALRDARLPAEEWPAVMTAYRVFFSLFEIEESAPPAQANAETATTA